MKTTYFIYGHSIGLDGEKQAFWSKECESKHAPMYWHERGLMQTRSGYGKRIATATMVKFEGRWRRVYCCIFSNIGTCYIGKLSDGLIVQEYSV